MISLTVAGLVLSLSPLTASGGPPPSQKTYTLQECQQAALNNPNAALRWRLLVDKSNSAVELATTELGPIVTSSVHTQLTSSGDIYAADNSSVVSQDERARIGLTGRYTLYDTGKRVDDLHAARAALSSTKQTTRADELGLLGAVTDAYYAVLRYQRQNDSVNLLVQATQDHLNQAQTRYNLGTVTRTDVLIAQSILDSAKADAAARLLQLTSARAHLANLMGDDPTQSAPTVVQPPAEAELNVSTDELIERALKYSPDLARIDQDQLVTRAHLSSTRAERSPAVGVSAETGYLFRTSKDEPYFFVSLGISLPLFEGPSLHAREHNLQDEMKLGDLDRRQFQYDLKERILVASDTYQTSMARIKQSMDSVQASEEAARFAQERYAVGKGTQTDVIDALHRLAAARDILSGTLNDRDAAAQSLRWISGLFALPPIPAVGGLRNDMRP